MDKTTSHKKNLTISHKNNTGQWSWRK